MVGHPGQRFVIWPFPGLATGSSLSVSPDGHGEMFLWSAIDGKTTLLAGTIAGFWSGWAAGTLPPY